MKTTDNKRTIYKLINNEYVPEYDIIKTVGKGSYGKVYLAEHRKTRKKVAVKEVRCESNEGISISTLREILHLKYFNHDNIVRLLDVVDYGKAKTPLYLILDYCPHDLMGLIHTSSFFDSEEKVKTVMKQLLEAVAHIHEKNCMHRDVKPANILLTRDGVAKLADFGLARKYNDREGRYTNNVVTPWYRAPELILGAENYTNAVDIWSVGCILGEFMLKRPLFPYGNQMELLDSIFKLCGTPNPNTCPNLCKLQKWCQPKTVYKNRIREVFRDFDKCSSIVNLLQSMLELDPEKRITAKEALRHPWFSEYPRPNPKCMESLLDYIEPINEQFLEERRKHRQEQSNRHHYSPRQSNRYRYQPIQKPHKMSHYSGLRPHERKCNYPSRPYERKYNVR